MFRFLLSGPAWLKYSVLILQVVLAAFFLMASFGKFLGDPAVVGAFNTLGGESFGSLLRYFAGLSLVAGSIGMFLEPVRRFAAVGLLAYMVVTVATHIFVFQTGFAFQAVLLILSAYVAWAHWTRD